MLDFCPWGVNLRESFEYTCATTTEPTSRGGVMMNKLTRRDFAKTATAAGVTTALGSLRVRGANDRVRLGFIGLGNRGDQVLDAFLAHKDSEVVAICDLHQPYLDFASKKIGSSPRQFKDYRKLLE